ncbi:MULTISPECIES: lipid kinase YegS [Shewanella]|uniref:Lipid kinase YegS n=1 Tax=Shewanella marisflavi TaxID=260364 RepID=A0ABX5WR15_9GAMM|nr:MULTISPECIES: lipid kinase YegS [Shewanella]QDF76626.1 lipid kinase YegS [Shewanella marisflavi]
MTLRIILNGKKAGIEEVREAIARVREDHDIQVRVTFEAGDVARLVDEAIAEGCSRIVAAGGDGTLNELVDALMGHPKEKRCEAAILPLGTANDFAAAAEVPEDYEAALRLAAEGEAYGVDVIRANDRHVINIASGGFGAQVTSNTPVALKHFLGGGAYTLSGLVQALNFKPYDGEFVIHGESSQQQLLVGAVCNGRQAGGGQVLAPEAYINDGLMDLVALQDFPIEVLAQVIAELQNPESDNQYVKYHRQPSACWRSNPPMPINLDGEPITETQVDFEIQAAAISLVLPADCPMLKPGTQPITNE